MTGIVRVCEACEGPISTCDATADAHSVPPVAQGAGHPECGSNSPNKPEIIKFGHGGRRPNTGGARPGAGRKRKPAPSAVPAVLRGRRWICAEAWVGRELQVLVHLGSLQLDTFLPLYQPKPGAVLEPAFPGYVFVHVDLDQPTWRRIHQLPGVIGLLQHDAERPMLVPEAVMARLVLAFGVGGTMSEAAARPEWLPLKTGAVFDVLEGPFTGFPALVAEDMGERVRVSVQIFGRFVSCVLPRLAIGPG